jgi:hypothetical protein
MSTEEAADWEEVEKVVEASAAAETVADWEEVEKVVEASAEVETVADWEEEETDEEEVDWAAAA